MNNFESNIRNAVRAVIIRDGRILLIRKEYEDGSERFALPGGAQDVGETLLVALDRECREEIGANVMQPCLLYVADWFKPRATVPPSTRHLVEFLFACEVDHDYIPQNGHHPDKHQVEVVWVELEKLDSVPLYPRRMVTILQRIQYEETVYLGTIE